VILAATDNVSMAKLSPKRRRAARHYVRQWREYRGLTQIEAASTDLTEDMIYSLADAFHCAPWDILRVNPMMEGLVVDIADALRGQPADIQAEALGFVRGLTRKG
jgi:hypothetical protein